ncbi:peroxide stress protein YaaA [Pseudidiomarina salilacus]|uniref:peroxide stress protein YaaA n=2 Tax=Pseudidiomarina salilacus TaxID=3384452 RepID=UPI003984A55B
MMLVVLSPAKNLDYESTLPTDEYSQPRLLEYAQELVDRCQSLTPQELSSLMKISDKLAGLNAARFAEWHQPFSPENARPAVFAFDGDVYSGLQAEKMSAETIAFAQEHLRILSGLYGVLRPLDLMQPYRLEMGTKLDTARGKNLYEFWGNVITDQLNEDLAAIDSDILVNLASNEYFSSVEPRDLKAQVITPVFKDEKNGDYKVISFWAKKARGAMARYIMNERVQDVAGLKQFNSNGYRFSPEQSSEHELVFLRAERDQ